MDLEKRLGGIYEQLSNRFSQYRNNVAKVFAGLILAGGCYLGAGQVGPVSGSYSYIQNDIQGTPTIVSQEATPSPTATFTPSPTATATPSPTMTPPPTFTPYVITPTPNQIIIYSLDPKKAEQLIPNYPVGTWSSNVKNLENYSPLTFDPNIPIFQAPTAIQHGGRGVVSLVVPSHLLGGGDCGQYVVAIINGEGVPYRTKEESRLFLPSDDDRLLYPVSSMNNGELCLVPFTYTNPRYPFGIFILVQNGQYELPNGLRANRVDFPTLYGGPLQPSNPIPNIKATSTSPPYNTPVSPTNPDNNSSTMPVTESGSSSGSGGAPPTQPTQQPQPTPIPTEECFLAGTKILVKNNKLKNIEKIKVGEDVLSYDVKKKKKVLKKVLELEKHENSKGYYSVKLSNGIILKLTAEHPIFTNKGWASIDSELTFKHQKLKTFPLVVGMKVLNNKGRWIKIKEIKKHNRKVKTYNLKKIEDTHTFYANYVLVHNKGGDDDDIGSGDG